MATLTLDMPRAGKSINWTGVTDTPAWAKTTSSTVYGSITMVSGMTNSGTTNITMQGRGSFTFTSAGLTWSNPLIIEMVGGTLTLQDALASGASFSLNNGTFNCNNFNLQASSFNSSGSLTRTATMGSGTHTFTTGSSGIWVTVTTTNLTFNANTSTIIFTSTAAKTFNAGGLTFNNVRFAHGAGTAAITIAGSNTFNTFEDTGTAAHSILFTAGTTQTITTWAVSGTAGNLKSIDSTTTATHALVKAGGGTVSADYLNIQHSVATPATTWYAGANSTDNQAVATAGSGWIFTAPPGGGLTPRMMLLGAG